MKQSPTKKPWTRMTAGELAKATVEFDDPNYRPAPVPLDAALAARHRKALAELRHRSGKIKRRKIQVSVEDALLEKADAVGEQRGLSRCDLVTAGLRLLLSY